MLPLMATAAVGLLLPQATAVAPATVVVQTAYGSLRGRRGPLGDSFHNVPYARPPIGPLRFSPAQAQRPWAPAELDATGGGAAISCWQSGGADSTGINYYAGRKVIYQEDCLTLDIYRPPPSEGGAVGSGKLPVLLFIHGGGFTQGAAFEQDGTWLARSQKLLVAFLNYRLGPLGFLVSEELSEKPGSRGTGGKNGILDQITAIRWLKANAASFGGDGSRVTVMGERWQMNVGCRGRSALCQPCVWVGVRLCVGGGGGAPPPPPRKRLLCMCVLVLVLVLVLVSA
jgi:para-nitrobenzyl esterase